MPRPCDPTPPEAKGEAKKEEAKEVVVSVAEVKDEEDGDSQKPRSRSRGTALAYAAIGCTMLLILLLVFVAICSATALRDQRVLLASSELECVVQGYEDEALDDAPLVLDAFARCGRGGKVIFPEGTYFIKSVMNTTGLQDVEIELRGTLLVSFLSMAKRRRKC